MKLAILIGVLLVAACAPQAQDPSPVQQAPDQEESSLKAEQEAEQIVLPNLGPAPELQNEIWLNTIQPLRLADLRGSVVLIDMWTYG